MIEYADFADGTKSEINYQTVELNVTYRPEPVEEVIDESIDLVDQNTEENNEDGVVDVADSEILSDIDGMVESIYTIITDDTDSYVDQDDNALVEESEVGAVYDNVDVDKMADLLIQEMSGVITDGISQVNSINTVEPTADVLMWTE